MSDPSTLLVATCLGCPQLPPHPVQPPQPCNSQQHFNQDKQAVNEVHSCVSEPERLVSSLEPKYDRLEQPIPTLQASLAMAPRTSSPESSTAIHWSNTAAQAQPPLRMGSRGQAVSTLQTRLQQLGFYAGPIDGIFGDRTKSAVVQFQKARGLYADGIIGLKTWAELQRVSPSPDVMTSKPESSSGNERDSSEESRIVSSPSPKVAIPAPPRLTHTIPVVSQLPPEYFWFVGWAIIYIGAGAIILRSAPQELAYFGFVKIQVEEKQFDAAIKQVALNQESPVRNRPVVIPRYAIDHDDAINEASSKESSHLRTVRPTPNHAAKLSPAPASPQKESTLASNDQKKVAWANRGQVKPLHSVFASLPSSDEMDDSDASENNATATTSDSYTVENERSAESSASWNRDDEKLVAVLPVGQPENGGAYTYSLINDAGGLFVLRGNELRVVAHRLTNSESRPGQITLRRISAEGTSVTKSFTLEIQKGLMKQA